MIKSELVFVTSVVLSFVCAFVLINKKENWVENLIEAPGGIEEAVCMMP